MQKENYLNITVDKSAYPKEEVLSQQQDNDPKEKAKAVKNLLDSPKFLGFG